MQQSPRDLRRVEGTLFSIDQTALHDGPGVRMNVYLKGCPLRCFWCHSPESQSFGPEIVWYETRCERCERCIEVCPEGIRSLGLIDEADRARCRLCGACVEACPTGALEMVGRKAQAGEIADEAARLKPFFRRTGGGVTLSGGEPTAQPELSYAIAALCQQSGIHVAMETCGAVTWEVLERLSQVVDLFLYDVKHVDPVLHEEYTGASNVLILDNLRRLAEASAGAEGADIIVRVPLIPTINDDLETIRAIAGRVAELGVRRMTLLPFNPATAGKYSWVRREGPLEGATRQSQEQLASLAHVVREQGLEVRPA